MGLPAGQEVGWGRVAASHSWGFDFIDYMENGSGDNKTPSPHRIYSFIISFVSSRCSAPTWAPPLPRQGWTWSACNSCSVPCFHTLGSLQMLFLLPGTLFLEQFLLAICIAGSFPSFRSQLKYISFPCPFSLNIMPFALPLKKKHPLFPL